MSIYDIACVCTYAGFVHTLLQVKFSRAMELEHLFVPIMVLGSSHKIRTTVPIEVIESYGLNFTVSSGILLILIWNVCIFLPLLVWALLLFCLVDSFVNIDWEALEGFAQKRTSHIFEETGFLGWGTDLQINDKPLCEWFNADPVKHAKGTFFPWPSTTLLMFQGLHFSIMQ